MKPDPSEHGAGDGTVTGGVLGWFARSGISANLLMWLIVAGGLLSVSGIRTQLVADSSYEILTVSVPYPGADPGEVDTAVCVRVGESLQGLNGIRRVDSTATQGLCYVQVHLVHGFGTRQALDDVQARIDAIDSFPEDVEKPVVQEFDPPSHVLSLVISGPADERTLARLGERTRDELRSLPGVTLVTLAGVRPSEIAIEVSEETLRRYGLTFSQVAEAVRRSSVDLPGGSVKSRGGDILLRTRGQADSRRQFEDLVLLSRGDGTRLTLGEVAEISDGFVEDGEVLRFDGQPAVRIDVARVGGQTVARIAAEIEAYLEKVLPRLPEGIRLTVWNDRSQWLIDRVGTLLANGRDGLVLVLVVLALFLRLHLAAWVAAGILVAFLGTVWGMVAFGQPITLASLVGFIIAIGLVVDDALVVGENVYRHHQAGAQDAAADGAREVAGPVIFSVLTTIAAFSPLLGLPGVMGDAFRALAIVVILALAVSLVESLLVLPYHLSHLPTADPTAAEPAPSSAWKRLQNAVDLLLEKLVGRFYVPALERALAWRATALALAFTVLLVSLSLVAGGHLRFLFFRPVDADSISIGLTLPQGTPAEVTATALSHVENAVEQLDRELAENGEPGTVRHVLTSAGSLPAAAIGFSDPARLPATGSHLGGVTVELAAGDRRTTSTAELGHRLRRLVGAIPDAVEVSFDTAILAAGNAVDVELSGSDLDQLRLAASELKTTLAGYPGVHDIADSLRPGKREVRLSVTPEGQALGVDLAELSRQVRQGFHGEEVQRLQRERRELKVIVRYPQTERRLLASVENMRIRTAGGGEVPFAVAGRLDYGRSFASIGRTNGRWTVRVTADVDWTRGDSNEIVGDLRRSVLPDLADAHPGLGYGFTGEQQEQRDTLDALRRNTLLALFSIYALLAVASGSYLQPLIVMAAIPFGIVGAIWGHVLMGFPLTIWSLLGMVALAGVVVNDSLVLVDFVNRARQRGTPLAEALRQAGGARFRPVVLTSVTTFAGLAPLLLEKSVQAQYLIPIAISLGFGVLFATAITLFLVPVGYSLIEGLHEQRLAPAASGCYDTPGQENP